MEKEQFLRRAQKVESNQAKHLKINVFRKRLERCQEYQECVSNGE